MSTLIRLVFFPNAVAPRASTSAHAATPDPPSATTLAPLPPPFPPRRLVLGGRCSSAPAGACAFVAAAVAGAGGDFFFPADPSGVGIVLGAGTGDATGAFASAGFAFASAGFAFASAGFAFASAGFAFASSFASALGVFPPSAGLGFGGVDAVALGFGAGDDAPPLRARVPLAPRTDFRAHLRTSPHPFHRGTLPRRSCSATPLPTPCRVVASRLGVPRGRRRRRRGRSTSRCASP